MTVSGLMKKVNLFRSLGWAIAAILIAVGFDFHTPAWHFQQLYAENAKLHQVDSILTVRISQADSDRESIRSQLNKYTRILSVAQCLDRPRRETAIMGLDCNAILKGGQ